MLFLFASLSTLGTVWRSYHTTDNTL